MKLLVLGGTVYLSKTVAELGVERGHEVTVAARGVSGAPPTGVRFIQVDRASVDGLAGLRNEAFEAVVDVARLPGHVSHALDALGSNAGHWTFVSTCSVYSDQSTSGQTAATAPLLEPTPPDSLEQSLELYGQNKVACENLVRRHIAQALIIRAGLIVGPGDPNDRFGYWPYRIVQGGEILAPGEPDDKVQFIDVRDLAEWILDASENGVTGTYDGICQPISRESFLQQIAAAMGTRPTFTWLPQEFLELHGVNPWAGEESLGLWLPLPEYAGFMSRDTSASVQAGMKVRPLGETARDWFTAKADPPHLLANLSRSKEAEVLAAWHTRSNLT